MSKLIEAALCANCGAFADATEEGNGGLAYECECGHAGDVDMSDNLTVRGPVYNHMPATGYRPRFYVTIHDADVPLVDCWGDSESDAVELADGIKAFLGCWLSGETWTINPKVSK